MANITCGQHFGWVDGEEGEGREQSVYIPGDQLFRPNAYDLRDGDAGWDGEPIDDLGEAPVRPMTEAEQEQ